LEKPPKNHIYVIFLAKSTLANSCQDQAQSFFKKMYNSNSFNEFYQQAWRYCKPRLNKIINNIADTEDVFAEAIARFWVHNTQGAIAHDSNHQALVYVMARNLWLGQYRKNKNQHTTSIDTNAHEPDLQIPDTVLDTLNSWIAQADSQSTENAISQAWQKLDTKCQTLLTATIIYKQKQENIVQQLGLKNTDTIKASKYRCLQYLKKFYYQFAA
jgi:RNA polymerase sigma factor (sigma-70 family)